MAGLLNVLTSEVDPSEDNAARADGQQGLSLEIVVIPFLYFGKFFPRKLGISRLETEGSRGVYRILGEVHPV